MVPSDEGDAGRELFRTLLDQSTDSVLVIDPETAEYLDVNETACRRRGYSREELLRLSVPDVETEIPDREAWRSFVEGLQTEGDRTFDGYHRRKDGSTYPVEVNASYVELDRAYVVAVARDVTERRERERELEQYRALTQAASDVIVTIDERSVVRSVNPSVADVFGYEQSEVVEEPLTLLMPDEFTDQHFEGVDRYLATGERTLDWEYVELPGRHADGSEIPLAVSFGEAEFGDERFFTGIMRDISERKRIQRRLEASNERLEQFAYAASHDLQEPLRMITSYLMLIEQRYGDELDEDGEEFLEFAVDGADRMKAMIDGLLEYSRVETQGDPFTAVDLDAVFDDVLVDLQVQTEESGAEITAESLPTVEGDPAQLRQVFQNLLSNAVEYSGDAPPRIHVAAERRGAAWTVSVSDEGVGIESDATDEIFEVFRRLHGRDEHAGTGIGLALCRRIVERHGGDIWVESEPGEGSTFSFTLPAVDEDPK
ncbi:sensor histidine kinase [Halosimplex sp. TS25]|uniref:sensor histidine kinase n=1 Tax=Halosimplex rarum TaxID=3396619 RepID=UPI0039EAF6FF